MPFDKKLVRRDALRFMRLGVRPATVRLQAARPAFMELFCGLAHMARAANFQKCGGILTLDNDPRRVPQDANSKQWHHVTGGLEEPAVRKRVDEWVESMRKRGHIVIGHASPPCTWFSLLSAGVKARRKPEELQKAIEFTEKAIAFIGRSTSLWTLENPASECWNSLWTNVASAPAHTHDVHYCAFGGLHQKPTRFAFSDAGAHAMFEPKRCDGKKLNQCRSCYTDPVTGKRKHVTIDQIAGASGERAAIPQQLALNIVDVMRIRVKEHALRVADALEAMLASRRSRASGDEDCCQSQDDDVWPVAYEAARNNKKRGAVANDGVDERKNADTRACDDDDDDQKYPVAALMDYQKRRVHGRSKGFVLVRWEGYSPQDDTWEPRDVLEKQGFGADITQLIRGIRPVVISA